MLDLVRELAALDLQLTHETTELRWGPATTLFAFASLWWTGWQPTGTRDCARSETPLLAGGSLPRRR